MNTSPATAEQPGDNGALPITSLPDEVLIANIFSYLGSKDLSHAGQVCRRLNIVQRMVWQRHAQELCQACSGLFASFGIPSLGSNPSQAEAAIFLKGTRHRIGDINNALPENLHSSFSVDDLVCTVDPGYMKEFLQKAYDHALRTVFGELAQVPENASLEESVHRIREWLQTAEVKRSQELYLRQRGLCCLPREIGQMTELRWLFLSKNQLASLPPEIGRLKELHRIELNDNHLTSLPGEIGQLKRMQRLDLEVNQLTSIPPEIGRLTALHWLSLDDNRLTSLPPEIGQLKELQELFLDGNPLISLPPEIGQLKALWELRLDSNQITSPPPAIGRLTAPR